LTRRAALPPRILLMIGALLVLVAAGCSGSSTHETPEEQALVTAKASSRAAPAKSPSAVVLQLWRAVQVGDVPSAVGLYDPRVRGSVGFTTIAGTLAQERSALAVLRPQIVSISRTPIGLELVVRATSRGSGVGVQSFLLRKGSEGWRVVYDTLLGDALAGYVQIRVQHRVAPRSNVPAPAAQLAGERASLVYQALFADTLPGAAKPPPVVRKPRAGK
jgi:hypothetical protein